VIDREPWGEGTHKTKGHGTETTRSVSFLCLYLTPNCRSTSSRLAVCLAVFAVYALTQRTSSLRFGRFPVIRIPTLYILAAIHVTATIDTPRIPSDSANS